MTRFFVAFFRRWMPDPFSLALVLTVVVGIAAAIWGTAPPEKLFEAWYGGLVKILPFTIEMALILVTGHALASAPIIRRGLRWLASLPKTEVTAVFTVFGISALAAWLNWGFGLVVAGLLAVEVGRRNKVDYAFLVAAAYSGFIVWHSGLSGSIPIVLATPGHKLNFLAAQGRGVTPLAATIFSPVNLAVVAALVILVPIVLVMVRPRGADREPFSALRPLDESDEEREAPAEEASTPAARLDRSIWLTAIILLVAAAYLGLRVYDRGFSLDLHLIIFLFLFAGMALHPRPVRYGAAFARGVKIAAPILLQYPFYGGIMGLVSGSGLAAVLSSSLADLSGPSTLPLVAFLSAGLLNVVIPSGGGQWAVQGEVMLQASGSLGVDPVHTSMAVAWGDQWTNMIQPMWALPILALAGREARHIMGYCVVTLLVSGAIFAIATFFG